MAEAIATPARDRNDKMPRFREAGDVTLDLFHRDGRAEDRWLGLHPQEFELFWRLCEEPGTRVSRKHLLADVWRIFYEPETNSIAEHIARLRGKLGRFGLSHIIATDPDGGYYLDAPPGPSAFRFSRPGAPVLDSRPSFGHAEAEPLED